MTQSPAAPSAPSKAEIERLVAQYDPEANFRRLAGIGALVVTLLGVALSLFHIYTAGYGILNEIMHRSIHLSFVLSLIFLCFPDQKRLRPTVEWPISLGFAAFYLFLAVDLVGALAARAPVPHQVLFFAVIGLVALLALPIGRSTGGRDRENGRIPLRDWLLSAAAASISVYFIVFFHDIFVVNVGAPKPLDYMMGILAIVMVIEATRRTMGLSLPIIGVVCILYGMLGPYLPGVLAHRGYNILRIVNHIYIGTEGIYGIAVGVVATYVFHFVLFGVLMQLTGLGQLFIDIATVAAGRLTGGAAKVSVVSSGLFGMISGSPVANTVTTGSLTIPMMKKSGFSPRFSGAVEASASCGGQVTPPVMGASAFVMAEMLGVPYSELILIAIFPALFHYVAILLMVHYEAKKLGLKGVGGEAIPGLGSVIARRGHLLFPLVVLVTLLLMHYTPFLAAFWGIILTIGCSYLPLILRPIGFTTLDRSSALAPRQLIGGLESGAKYALGIGAACACVGFILGIASLTGIGFKFSGAVLDTASSVASGVLALDVTGLLDRRETMVFFALVFVALTCILMGTGIPTTPTYIILASIAAPALADLKVPLLITHFFVFYYGVLADVTPPVALAAFAGAGIAGSEPMRTGVTAFRLSMGKALVPFMFVYAPSLLLQNFDWSEFVLAMASGMLSILAMSVAYIGYFHGPVRVAGQIVLTIGGLLLIFSNPYSIAAGAALVLAVLVPNAVRGPPQAGMAAFSASVGSQR